MGIFCLLSMPPLIMCLRRRLPSIPVPPVTARSTADAAPSRADHGLARPLGLSPGSFPRLLYVAGVAWCVVMVMAPVHLEAHCGALDICAQTAAQSVSDSLGMGLL